jgi:hypothetical protein
VSQEECAILREVVPYVQIYRYNPKHICPKLNGYGDNVHMQTLKLIRGSYEVRRSDGFRHHDIRTKFYKDWFRHREVNVWVVVAYTETESMEIA